MPRPRHSYRARQCLHRQGEVDRTDWVGLRFRLASVSGANAAWAITGSLGPISPPGRSGIVGAMWRYFDYKFDPQSNIQSFNLNGPLIAATFHW